MTVSVRLRAVPFEIARGGRVGNGGEKASCNGFSGRWSPDIGFASDLVASCQNMTGPGISLWLRREQHGTAWWQPQCRR